MAGRFREAIQRCQQAGDGVSDHVTSGDSDNGERRGSIAACELRRDGCRADVSITNDRLAGAQGKVAGWSPGCDVESGATEFEAVFGGVTTPGLL